MFGLLDIRRTGLSGEAFAWRLLDEHSVVVMPGESFGAGGAGHIRVALTVDCAIIEEACRRIARLATSLLHGGSPLTSQPHVSSETSETSEAQ